MVKLLSPVRNICQQKTKASSNEEKLFMISLVYSLPLSDKTSTSFAFVQTFETSKELTFPPSSAVQWVRKGHTLGIVSNFPISKKSNKFAVVACFLFPFCLLINVQCWAIFWMLCATFCIFCGSPRSQTHPGIVLHFMLLMGIQPSQLKPSRISITQTRGGVYLERASRDSNLSKSWKSSFQTVDPTDIDIDPR